KTMSLLKSFKDAINRWFPPTIELGAPGTDEQPGVGTIRTTAIFNGAAEDHRLCTVRGSELAEGRKYYFNDGAVLIDGDVPNGARITVDNGKLYVNGHVGDDAELSAEVPVKFRKSARPMPLMHYPVEVYTHVADTEPALNITGGVGADTSLTSNHGIAVAGTIGRDVALNHTRDAGFATTQTGEAAHTNTTRHLTLSL
ncbi:MAG: hypothetical protein KKA05_04590, partial [Alphaproteobacteria bacterium]|nr:hypothetical protein [Alphaproteobacteria bacterium]